jgi:hypothetical protein
MPGTYEKIATTTLSSNQGTVTFSSIPATYTHLQIRGIGQNNNALQRDVYVTFNSDSGANYSYHRLTGDGATASSDAGTSATFMILGRVSQTGVSHFGALVIDIFDYANTNKYKTARAIAGRDANGSGSVWLNSGNWRSTNAITSITLKPQTDSWNQYSSFALYGVKA